MTEEPDAEVGRALAQRLPDGYTEDDVQTGERVMQSELTGNEYLVTRWVDLGDGQFLALEKELVEDDEQLVTDGGEEVGRATTHVRCAFPYYGGKTQYADRLVSRMPAHRRYVEAFGGGGSVLLAKARSEIEVFNDADEHLVNFFRVLRTREDELREWLDSALYARADHEEWAAQFYGTEDVPDDLDDVARAGRWFTLRHTQYGSVTKSVSGFSTPYKRNEAQGMRKNIERLDAVRDRFQNVVVECDDYEALVDRYDGPETFWYFDPPYVGNEHEYLGDFEHADLVAVLDELEGDWMVSYRELPDGLADLAETVDEIGGVDRADGVKDATERVVMSYDPAEKPRHTETEQKTLVTDGGQPADHTDAIKQCTLCGWKFDFGAGDNAGHVLEHWAKEHDDSEVFWSILNDYRTHTRCACCSEMFPSEIRPVNPPKANKDALVVDLYCEDCVSNEDFDNKLKSLMVTDVTGRYVIEHSEEVDDGE